MFFHLLVVNWYVVVLFEIFDDLLILIGSHLEGPLGRVYLILIVAPEIVSDA